MKKANLTHLWTQGLLMAAVIVAAVPAPDLAWAQNGLSGAIANSKGDVFNPLLNALSYGCYTVGGFLGIGGIMKLKAHSENPTNAPLSHGIGRVSAAAGFLALPSVMGVLNNTASSTLNSSSTFSQLVSKEKPVTGLLE